jgi:hypothetical protein
MILLEGQLLHKKQIERQGKENLPIVSILDENPRFSRVLDLADFENRFSEVMPGQLVSVPISIRINEGKDRSYINYAVADMPTVISQKQKGAA